MRRQFRTWTGALLLAAAMAFSAACAEEPTAAAQAPSAPTNPDQVVAEVAGKPITLKDVDAKWEEFDAAERARVSRRCTRIAATCSTCWSAIS